MTDLERRNESLDGLVKRLTDQTGISEGQALELIYLIGVNWSSLVREARTMSGSWSAGRSNPGSPDRGSASHA